MTSSSGRLWSRSRVVRNIDLASPISAGHGSDRELAPVTFADTISIDRDVGNVVVWSVDRVQVTRPGGRGRGRSPRTIMSARRPGPGRSASPRATARCPRGCRPPHQMVWRSHRMRLDGPRDVGRRPGGRIGRIGVRGGRGGAGLLGRTNDSRVTVEDREQRDRFTRVPVVRWPPRVRAGRRTTNLL
jgi:hypothetical protein